MHPRTAALLILLLSACGMRQSEFQREFAERYCGALAGCEHDDNPYQGQPDICERYVDELLEHAEDSDGCEYRRGKARACLRAVDDATCGDLVDGNLDACPDVYRGECGGGLATDTGF